MKFFGTKYIYVSANPVSYFGIEIGVVAFPNLPLHKFIFKVRLIKSVVANLKIERSYKIVPIKIELKGRNQTK